MLCISFCFYHRENGIGMVFEACSINTPTKIITENRLMLSVIENIAMKYVRN